MAWIHIESLLAVPYHAKDVPAVGAEFGHPDVAIALTCLSYYYGGLTKDQLCMCFQLLFRLDNPTVEYEKWIEGNDKMPQLVGVNAEDLKQYDHLFQSLHLNKAVIDFYLSYVVFSKRGQRVSREAGHLWLGSRGA